MTSTIFVAVVVVTFISTVKASDPSKLVLGKFELTSDIKSEEFNTLLKAMEYSDSQRDMIRSMKDIVFEIDSADMKHYKVTVKTGPKQLFVKDFDSGKEKDDQRLDGKQYKGTMTVTENKMIRDEKHSGFTCHHVATFNDKGCDMVYEVTKGGAKTTAKQNFKRINNIADRMDGKTDKATSGVKL